MKKLFSNKSFIEILAIIIILITILLGLTGCSSWDRTVKNWNSDLSGGLDRTVNVYTYNGEKIATYEGKIDLQMNESKVLFDLEGKRYVYYNAIVEVIEK